MTRTKVTGITTYKRQEGISFDKMEKAMKVVHACRVPGAREGIDAPEFWMRIKE